MSHIYVVVVKSSTGKDTLFQMLASDFDLSLKTLVGYTTRPIRDGEKEGLQYHFVSKDQLEHLKKEKLVIHHCAYNTAHGIWDYFTVNDGQINLTKKCDYIITGTIESFCQIRDYFGKDTVIPLYIEVETGERMQRALNRERKQEQPKYIEMCRRFIADEEDFTEENIEKAEIRIRYHNDDLNHCYQEIKKSILLHKE